MTKRHIILKINYSSIEYKYWKNLISRELDFVNSQNIFNPITNNNLNRKAIDANYSGNYFFINRNKLVMTDKIQDDLLNIKYCAYNNYQ